MRSLRLGLWLGVVGMVAACGGDEITQVIVSDSGLPRSRDAGTCISDLECSDGLFCNGAELCLPNASDANDSGCVAARTMPVCNDKIACTTDSCSDVLNRCDFAAPDNDGDGHRATTCEDANGAPLGDDCDDDDANRFPGNPEVCDSAHDEDCDLTTFGNRDRDGDRAFDKLCCNGTGTDALCGDDCDDNSIARRPLQVEVCDSIDNDCDEAVDEAMNTVPWFRDSDGDLFGGREQQGQDSCTPIVGASLLNTDCNDNNISQHPAQIELCDYEDNNCNGVIDEPVYCGGGTPATDGGISGTGGSGGSGGAGGTGGNGGSGGTGGGCATGFANCDTSNSDCETDITTIDHCGDCDVSCDATHAAVECVSMSCEVDTDNGGCAPGYADCDSSGETGCESPVASDAMNCGRCSRDCGGPTCTAGRCGPSLLMSLTQSPFFPTHQVAILTPSRFFTYSQSGNTAEVRVGYRSPNPLQLDGQQVASDPGLVGLTTDGAHVYWGQIGNPSVIRTADPTTGVSATGFTSTNAMSFSALTHFNGALYWANNPTSLTTAGTTVIYSRLLSGVGTGTALINGRDPVTQLRVTATKVIWIEGVDNGTYRLNSAPIGGGTVTPIAVVTSNTTIDVDATHVYWVADGTNNATEDGIWRTSLAGAPAVEELLTGVNGMASVRVDDTYLYFAAAGVAHRIPKAGNALPEPLSAASTEVKRIWDVDNQFLYVMTNYSGYDEVARIAK